MKNFLNTKYKTKGKVDKFYEIKDIRSLKDTVKKGERKATNWEKRRETHSCQRIRVYIYTCRHGSTRAYIHAARKSIRQKNVSHKRKGKSEVNIWKDDQPHMQSQKCRLIPQWDAILYLPD